MNLSESTTALLQQAVRATPLAWTGQLSDQTSEITELSAEVKFDVGALEDYTIALGVAYRLFDLMRNTSQLASTLSANGIDGLAVRGVKVQFLHPDEGLVLIEYVPIIEAPAAAQVVASETEESIATVSTLVAAAVAGAVAAAVGGAVGGAVAGAAGGAAGGGAAGGAGGGGGGAAGGVFPLMMGAQRLEMSNGIAVPKSEVQSGVADGLGWAGGNFGLVGDPAASDGRRLFAEELTRPKQLTDLLSSMLSLGIAFAICIPLQLLVFFWWKLKANKTFYELKKLEKKEEEQASSSRLSKVASVKLPKMAKMSTFRKTRKRTTSATSVRSVDGKSKIAFKKFPILFVYPSLFLIVYKLFVSGLVKNSATLLALPNGCDAACKTVASLNLAVAAFYVGLGWFVQIDFNRRFRKRQWKPAAPPRSAYTVDDPVYRAISVLRGKIFGHDDPRAIMNRSAGKYAKVPAEMAEPGRTERLMANPLSLHKAKVSDVLEAYQFAYFPLGGGRYDVSLYVNHLILTGQQSLGILCGIGSAGVMSAEASVIQVQVINGLQWSAFLYVWIVFPAHDRMDNLMFCCQFGLEGLQTSLLSNQGDDPEVAASIQGTAFGLSLLALAVPLIRRFYDGVLVPIIKSRRKGFSIKNFNKKAAALAFLTFVLQLQSFVLKMMGVSSEVASMTSSVTSNAAKLANREVGAGGVALVEVGAEIGAQLGAEAYAVLFGSDGPQTKHHDAATTFQKLRRTVLASRAVKRRKVRLRFIQAVTRGMLARKFVRRAMAAIFIQAYERGARARRRVRAYYTVQQAGLVASTSFGSRPGQHWLLREETIMATRDRIYAAKEFQSTRSFPRSLDPTFQKASCPTHAYAAGHLAHVDNHGPGGVVFHRHKDGLREALSSTRESIAKAALPTKFPPGFDDVPEPSTLRKVWLALLLFAEYRWEQVRRPVTLVLGYGLLGSQTFPMREKKSIKKPSLKTLIAPRRKPKDDQDEEAEADNADDDGGDGDGGDGDGGD